MRRINLIKSQRQFLFSWSMCWVVLSAGFMNARWWFIAIPLLGALAIIQVGRKITTKKTSLRFLKSARPFILLTTAIIFVTSATGTLKSNLIIILALAGLLGFLYMRLIRYELAAYQIEAIEHSLALMCIFLITNVMALSQAIWNWPLWLVLILGWLLHYSMVNFWLYSFVEKPERVSLLWSLLIVELAALSAFWLIFYAIPGTTIIISQLSLIITSLAYCMGGIYYHHKKHTLSRSLIFEYFGVSIVVFGILLILTRWFRGV